MWTALIATALAADLSVGATGGSHYATAQPWVGAELVAHPSQRKGAGGVGRVALGYAFGDRSPLGVVEGGLTYVVGQQQAIVRVGLVARMSVLGASYLMPIDPGGRDAVGSRHLGFVPAGLGLLEFAWPVDAESESTPLAFGVKAGVGSVINDWGCNEGDDPDDCVGFGNALVGGFTVRTRVADRVSLEGWIGTSMTVSVGYAF